MTREEILKLSNEELQIKATGLQGWIKAQGLWLHPSRGYGLLGCSELPDCLHSMNAAMDLFNEIYNPESKLYGGAWVLSTVDEGKDCSLATLFFGAPSRRARRQGRTNRLLKAQAKAKKKQMARAITLCFVMAMEGATVDLRYQPEEA